ncbi:MAG: ABC transporter permease [Mycoplasma sp.]|nr:ABC transporter permease [Mycoplasma sp.]
MVNIGFIAGFIILVFILLIASLSGYFSEKAGIINLSIEGYMCFGAIMYALIINKFKMLDLGINQLFIMLLAGFITLVIGLSYAMMVLIFKANQTIVGIAINALVIAISYFLIKETGVSNYLDVQSQFYSFGDYTNWGYLFNSTIILGLPLFLLGIIFIHKTKIGKLIKGVGENPEAIESIGYKVWVLQLIAILISSFLGGIAGSFFAQTSATFYGSVNGIGFIAVAIVIFGQWKILYICIGSIFFGIFLNFAIYHGQLPDLIRTVLPVDLIPMFPFVFGILSMVALSFITKSNAPAALGKPYVRKGR